MKVTVLLLVVACCVSAALAMRRNSCGTPDPHFVDHATPPVPDDARVRDKREVAAAQAASWKDCDTPAAYADYFSEDDIPVPKCANPNIRDDYKWRPSEDIELYSIIYVLRENDGSNPMLSDSDLSTLKDYINDAFKKSKIHFHFQTRYADSTTLRYKTVAPTDEGYQGFKDDVWNAKNTDDEADKAIRFYVANGFSGGDLLGVATFPYEPNVLGPGEGGGIVLTKTAAQAGDENTAPHEVGHVLGLYHTFQDGNSYFNPDHCLFCNVLLDPDDPNINYDESGDYCDDTPWVGPLHLAADYDCFGHDYDFCPIGDTIDTCTEGNSCSFYVNYSPELVKADAANYMSYYECDHEQGFTKKQESRMRCFIDYFLWEAKKVPNKWTCSKWFYNDQSKCTCGCGKRDPDCDKGSLKVDMSECGGYGDFCSYDGECSKCKDVEPPAVKTIKAYHDGDKLYVKWKANGADDTVKWKVELRKGSNGNWKKATGSTSKNKVSYKKADVKDLLNTNSWNDLTIGIRIKAQEKTYKDDCGTLSSKTKTHESKKGTKYK